MKIDRLIFLGLLIVCFNVSGKTFEKTTYFSIERILKDSYAIPLIKSDNHPEIADKINQIIQMTTINKLYNVVGKDKLFDKMINEDGYSGTTSLDYNILLNSEAILSIQFNDETLTAYPDYHTSYLNFNSATGDIIDINELLNKEGIEHLNDLASKIFNQSIKSTYYETIQDSLIGYSQKEEILESIFELTECNAIHQIWKFGITSDVLILEKDRCFPHAIQALDISWSCEIKIGDLYKSDFTLYGERLLNERIADNSLHFNEKVNEMAIHGKIDNKYPFCMYLWINSDNSIGGLYWYTKIGTLIDFKGKRISPNKIEITENSGKLDFILNENGSISGNWINKEGKLIPIEFE